MPTFYLKHLNRKNRYWQRYILDLRNLADYIQRHLARFKWIFNKDLLIQKILNYLEFIIPANTQNQTDYKCQIKYLSYTKQIT